MLRGSELLSKVKELGSMPKSEVVRACGYVSPRKDGSQRLNYTSFYEALLEAKGMSFGGAGESASRRDSVGRKLSYTAKVHFNGNLLVGKAYTSVLGLKPGDEFDIKLERKGIRLIPKHRSEDMMAGVSVPGEAPEEPSATAPVSSTPVLELETTASVAAQDAPVASPSVPPAPPVAPAPIPTPIPAPPPTPVAAPAAPPAPGRPPIPQSAPVATPAPANLPSAVPQQSSPQTPPVDSWEDSLRKLDQSSRPERWDA
ncbi:AbrB family transciptional regulator [Candidatus Synechococcus spongiarum]|uniref:AbrB family transciptional regulator n=1 Tax=Candidatus Synechococcus spongiarum TaxID=431041 RepID=A0A165B2F8_9SYNE|nr:AbrB family transciptional regulator [Candidatus Synechococcus spongiarum]